MTIEELIVKIENDPMNDSRYDLVDCLCQHLPSSKVKIALANFIDFYDYIQQNTMYAAETYKKWIERDFRK